MNSLDSEIAALKALLARWECADFSILTGMALVGVLVLLMPLAWWLTDDRRTVWVWRLSAFLVVLTCGQCAVAWPTSRVSDQYGSALERRTNLLLGAADERAARFESDAARARLETTQLRMRRFTSAQRRDLIDALRPFAGTGINVVLAISDSARIEDRRFGRALGDILTESEWTFSRAKFGDKRSSQFKGRWCRRYSGIGLALTSKKIWLSDAGGDFEKYDPELRAPADALIGGLRAAGLEARLTMWGYVAEGGSPKGPHMRISICPRF